MLLSEITAVSLCFPVCLLRAHGGSSRVLVERMTSRAERSGNGTLAGWATLEAASGRPYGAYHSDWVQARLVTSLPPLREADRPTALPRGSRTHAGCRGVVCVDVSGPYGPRCFVISRNQARFPRNAGSLTASTVRQYEPSPTLLPNKPKLSSSSGGRFVLTSNFKRKINYWRCRRSYLLSAHGNMSGRITARVQAQNV